MKSSNKNIKTTLLNIDSSTRNINPKNIFDTDNYILKKYTINLY
jgi:hypothetical protein